MEENELNENGRLLQKNMELVERPLSALKRLITARKK